MKTPTEPLAPFQAAPQTSLTCDYPLTLPGHVPCLMQAPQLRTVSIF